MIEDVVRPRGPYRLHLMTYGRELDQALPGGGRGQAWQRSDGLVQLRAPDEEGLELLRFCLALDADTTEFTRRFRNDPLLGLSIRRLHGLRPLRRPTVAAALLRAICGQLIEARRAFAIERAILRAIGDPAPRREAIAALSPAQLRKLGLATHRGSTLIRVCLRVVMPAVVTLAALQFMWIWNNFLMPLVMISSEELRTAPLSISYFQGQYVSDITLIAAACVIVALPVVAAYALLQRQFIAGSVTGAMKG